MDHAIAKRLRGFPSFFIYLDKHMPYGVYNDLWNLCSKSLRSRTAAR